MAFTDEQRRNAATIARVGQGMGLGQRDILIGLMTAMQESGLRNLHYGDRDSQGLFQQRPSMGWGSVAQVTDPTYSAGKFFSTLEGVKGRGNMSLAGAAQAVQRSAFPDAYAKHEGAARELLSSLGGGGGSSGGSGTDFSGVPQLAGVGDLSPEASPGAAPALTSSQVVDPAAQAAQALRDQQSQNKVKSTAGTAKLLTGDDDTTSLLDVKGQGEGAQEAFAPLSVPTMTRAEYDTASGAAPPVDLGQSETIDLGTTRSFTGSGGGVSVSSGGGSGGSSPVVDFAKKWVGTPYVWGGTGPLGFDCSGLIQYVYKNALGVDLPRVSYQQARAGKGVSMQDLQPGDLVAWDNSPRNPGADHIAIYAGGGNIIEAPRPGKNVQVRALDSDDYAHAWGRRVV